MKKKFRKYRLCYRICLLAGWALIASAAGAQVKFEKLVVNAGFVAEGVGAADVNRDGATDIVAGHYWFEAPAWKRHLLHADTAHPVPGYSTSFVNFCADVNEDGWPDLIRFDEPGGICRWYKNPGSAGTLWTGYTILEQAGIETPLLVDVDGDGRMNLICNDAAAKEVIWLQPPANKEDTAWQRHVISRDKDRATNRYTHGLGWGDVNRDGRKDVIVRTGWWQAPANVKEEDWAFHPASFGEEAANMFALDADEDGDMDIISSSAHQYGIWWHEQVKNNDHTVSWTTHEISRLFSQSHALALQDINGDGHPDLVSGKRYLAHHDGHDPGSYEPAVLYWFEYKPGSPPQWIPHLIDDNSGIGNAFVVQDINNDGMPDIVVSNKKGVYFFKQVK